MTTLVSFIPSPRAPFQFQATLDGVVYNVIVTWNTGGQRWYVNVYDQSNTLIFTLPMIGSPPAYDISLTAGYFTSTMIFRQTSQQFEITP